jgi:membrane-bound lytic murein transglycosylase D
MAAYNAGENRVDEAIARCGYADFWELHRRGLLPNETRNYVPTILAIMIVSKNQHRYGFHVNPDPSLAYETYELPSQTDLRVIADICGVPGEALQDLNPELRRGTSPPGERYTIKLPKGSKKTFEVAYANLPEDQRVRKVVVAREETAESYRSGYRTQLVAYRARRGDTLSTLSRRYGVSVRELERVNRMSARKSLHKGQTVRVPTQLRTYSARGRSVRAFGKYHEQTASEVRFGRHHHRRGRAFVGHRRVRYWRTEWHRRRR